MPSQSAEDEFIEAGVFKTSKKSKLDVSTLDFGMSAAIEVQYKITPMSYLSLEGSLFYGLTDVYKHQFEYTNRTVNFSNTIVYGGIGWGYILGKTKQTATQPH